MTKLFIYATDLHANDAVCNYSLGLCRLAERLNLSPALVALRSSLNSLVLSIAALAEDITSDSLLIVNYSIYEPDLNTLLSLPCRKICYFHGVTPPELMAQSSPETAQLCQQAMVQLAQLQAFDQVLANSHQSAQQLAEQGVTKGVSVMPPVFADAELFRHGVLDLITFTAKVLTFDLYQTYLSARLLLSTSAHEGFCVPALEAMYFGKPVFAKAGTAMDDFLIKPCQTAQDQSSLAESITTYLKSEPNQRDAKRLHQQSLAVLEQSSDAQWQALLKPESMQG